MRSLLFIALLGAAAAVHAAAPPAPGVAAVSNPPAAVPADGDKLVCRRETVIGSNVPGKRVCKPKSQILAEQAIARDTAREMTTPAGSNSGN